MVLGFMNYLTSSLWLTTILIGLIISSAVLAQHSGETVFSEMLYFQSRRYSVANACNFLRYHRIAYASKITWFDCGDEETPL